MNFAYRVPNLYLAERHKERLAKQKGKTMTYTFTDIENKLARYEVTLTSELLDGPFIVECVATSADRAATRCRAAAMHSFRCVEMLGAHCETRVLEYV